jgi:hypothetical protein
MKTPRDKLLKNRATMKRTGKSLSQLYHELLYLREEVREAEQRSTKGAPHSLRPERNLDNDA